jgi:hypothetical protein
MFHAASAGDWANDNLRVRIDYVTAEKPAAGADRTTYNLTAFDKSTGVTERFLNISIDPASPGRCRSAAGIVPADRPRRGRVGAAGRTQFEGSPTGRRPLPGRPRRG